MDAGWSPVGKRLQCRWRLNGCWWKRARAKRGGTVQVSTLVVTPMPVTDSTIQSFRYWSSPSIKSSIKEGLRESLCLVLRKKLPKNKFLGWLSSADSVWDIASLWRLSDYMGPSWVSQSTWASPPHRIMPGPAPRASAQTECTCTWLNLTRQNGLTLEIGARKEALNCILHTPAKTHGWDLLTCRTRLTRTIWARRGTHPYPWRTHTH